MGTLIPLFWTSGDVSPGCQSQGEFFCLHALLPVCKGFLRFTSGAPPADHLTASMVTEPFRSTHTCVQALAGARVQHRADIA